MSALRTRWLLPLLLAAAVAAGAGGAVEARAASGTLLYALMTGLLLASMFRRTEGSR